MYRDSEIQKGFEAYRLYLALKSHFTRKNYDFFKYRGKVRANIESFKKRNDRGMFIRFSKIPKYKEILLSNFIYGMNSDDLWIGNLINSPAATKKFNRWRRYNENFEYEFEEDIKRMNPDFRKNFEPENGTFPSVIQLVASDKISIETFAILDDIMGIFDYWDEKNLDKWVLNDLYIRVNKVKSFITHDKSKAIKVLKKLKDKNEVKCNG